MANLVTGIFSPSVSSTGFIYDFAADGGLVGSLDSKVFLPANVFCTVYIDVVTTFTSGGAATINLTCAGASLLATGALAIADLGAGGTGGEAFALPGAGFHVTRIISGGGVVSFAIGTAALTAGKANIYIEYSTFVVR